MMGWKIYDEAIDMAQRRFGYTPQVFNWRGRRYEVEELARSWETPARRRGRPRAARRFFQLRCGEGLFEVYQDLESGAWHLRRARRAPARRPVVGAMVPAWR